LGGPAATGMDECGNTLGRIRHRFHNTRKDRKTIVMTTATESTSTPAKILGTILPTGPKLNIGCGPVQPDGWDNIDGSNRAYLTSRLNWLDKSMTWLGAIRPTTFRSDTIYADLFKVLPYGDSTVSCIYAGELWEHFEYEDAAKLTRECLRVLKPGGVLRLCVPDGMQYWPKYIALVQEQLNKPKSERNAEAIRKFVTMFFNDICTRPNFTKSFGHYHKWQFDEIQLVELMETSKFEAVARMPFHQSRITDIGRLERSDFLIVEGVKPRG
jgi:predicted SAM-dependent methyltransferase